MPATQQHPGISFSFTVRVSYPNHVGYPNQINNVLAFPGIFRGALDVRAREITEEMKVAAAHAIADSIPEPPLNPEFIVPSVFDHNVVKKVAIAVSTAAVQVGVARRQPKPQAPSY